MVSHYANDCSEHPQHSSHQPYINVGVDIQEADISKHKKNIEKCVDT